MDEITLNAEPLKEMGSQLLTELSQKLSERLKTETNLRFNINLVKYGELQRYTLKAKRFKDLRERRKDAESD